MCLLYQSCPKIQQLNILKNRMKCTRQSTTKVKTLHSFENESPHRLAGVKVSFDVLCFKLKDIPKIAFNRMKRLNRLQDIMDCIPKICFENGLEMYCFLFQFHHLSFCSFVGLLNHYIHVKKWICCWNHKRKLIKF